MVTGPKMTRRQVGVPMMTDMTEATTNGGSTPPRTSAALRLPKVSFEKVRELVDASLQLSGSASAAVIADQMGRAAKGQAWSDR